MVIMEQRCWSDDDDWNFAWELHLVLYGVGIVKWRYLGQFIARFQLSWALFQSHSEMNLPAAASSSFILQLHCAKIFHCSTWKPIPTPFCFWGREWKRQKFTKWLSMRGGDGAEDKGSHSLPNRMFFYTLCKRPLPPPPPPRFLHDLVVDFST